jgi:hypothetical protein
LEIDGNSFGKTPDDIQTIQNLPIIIEDGIDEIGTYEFGNFVLHVNTLEQIPHEKILRPYFQNVF